MSIRSAIHHCINAIAALLVCAPCAWASASAATTWTYPSAAAPCNATLQACIDATTSGDTIELANVGSPNHEYVTVSRTLTLQRPAGGSMPLIRHVRVEVDDSTSVALTIKGVKVTTGVTAISGGSGNLTLRLANNEIGGTDNDSGNPVIEVNDSGSGPLGTKTVLIEHNFIYRGPSIQPAILVAAAATSFDTTIRENAILVPEIAAGGIQLFLTNGRSGVALIERNSIFGFSGINAGIALENAGFTDEGQSGGALTARLFNNLVKGQKSSGGSSGGITADVRSGGLIDLLAVNNTIADGNDGLSLYTDASAGSTIKAGLYNNIVARHSGKGVSVLSEGVDVQNSNNLFFANILGNEGFTPGAGTRTGDPAFKSPSASGSSGDYQLTATSDAIDHGIDPTTIAAVGTAGVGDLDLVGNPRIQGGAVDIGATEFVTIAVPALEIPTLNSLSAIGLGLLVFAFGLSGLHNGRTSTRRP